MKIITPELLAKDVAALWNTRYSNGRCGIDKVEIGKKLFALENPTPETISSIIGNSSWTKTECGECGAKNIPVIEIGECTGQDSYTAYVCLSCIEQAKAALLVGKP